MAPGGTIIRTVFDVRGQAAKSYEGTNDAGATVSDPTGGGASGNNMVLVSETEYDEGAAWGDGLVTKTTTHVDATTTRVTTLAHDFRGRLVDTNGEIDYFQRQTYDNLDHVVKTDRFNTTSSGTLIARNETKVDDLGRVYKTIRYAVNPASGAVGDALVDRVWHDLRGAVIKQQPGGTQQFTKAVYDSLGHATRSYVGYDSAETSLADAGTVTGDTIFEQAETTYDAAGNVVQVAQRSRLHDATGTGELSTPAGSDRKSVV